MQVNDITSYLYQMRTEAAEKSKSTDNAGKTSATTGSEDTSSFASVLTEKISDLNEMQDLSEVLDKSVLGTFSQSMDISELSEELMSTSSGRAVISQLASGQLDAIAMSDSDDSDDEDSTTSSLMSSLTTSTDDTESLEDILEEFSEIVAEAETKKAE